MKAWTIVATVLLASGSHVAWAADPKVPPGQTAGGSSIAILTTGIDYVRPEIAARLARDGEGEIIGWDFVDNDRFPYAVSPNDTPANWGGDGTRLATALLTGDGGASFALILIRIDPLDKASLAKAVVFASQTPAIALLVPIWTREAKDWDLFAEAVKRTPRLPIVVPRCPPAPGARPEPVYPYLLALPNIIWGEEGMPLDEPLRSSVLSAINQTCTR